MREPDERTKTNEIRFGSLTTVILINCYVNYLKGFFGVTSGTSTGFSD